MIILPVFPQRLSWNDKWVITWILLALSHHPWQLHPGHQWRAPPHLHEGGDRPRHNRLRMWRQNHRQHNPGSLPHHRSVVKLLKVVGRLQLQWLLLRMLQLSPQQPIGVGTKPPPPIPSPFCGNSKTPACYNPASLLPLTNSICSGWIPVDLPTVPDLCTPTDTSELFLESVKTIFRVPTTYPFSRELCIQLLCVNMSKFHQELLDFSDQIFPHERVHLCDKSVLGLKSVCAAAIWLGFKAVFTFTCDTPLPSFWAIIAAGGFGYISPHEIHTLLMISDVALLQVKHHIIPASNPLTPCLLIKCDRSAITLLHSTRYTFSFLVSLFHCCSWSW